MKKTFFLSLFTLLNFSVMAQEPAHNDKINWHSMEELLEVINRAERPIYILFYGGEDMFSQRFRDKTLSNQKIVTYMNSNYYAVDFEILDNKTYTYNGKKYKNKQHNGIHPLFGVMTEGTSYPTGIFYYEGKKVLTLNGYKDENHFYAALRYANGNFKNMTFEEFLNTKDKNITQKESPKNMKKEVVKIAKPKVEKPNPVVTNTPKKEVEPQKNELTDFNNLLKTVIETNPNDFKSLRGEKDINNMDKWSSKVTLKNKSASTGTLSNQNFEKISHYYTMDIKKDLTKSQALKLAEEWKEKFKQSKAKSLVGTMFFVTKTVGEETDMFINNYFIPAGTKTGFDNIVFNISISPEQVLSNKFKVTLEVIKNID